MQETPEMYEFSQELLLRARGYRKFLIGNYVALYLVDTKNQKVWIARIFHGSQDYQKYL